MGHLVNVVTKNIRNKEGDATKNEKTFEDLFRANNKRVETKRVNYVSEEEEEEEEEEEKLVDDEMVLQVDRDGKSPLMIKGLLCRNEFKAIKDTGSPISIFPIDELQRIVGKGEW